MSSGDFFISVEVEKKIFETFAAFFGIFGGGARQGGPEVVS